MHKFEKFSRIAVSAIGAVMLSALSIGAAVGPARAVETAPVVGYTQLQIEANA